MFALLALGGDLGCAAGPTLVGTMAEVFGGDIKQGMIFGVVFPAALILALLLLKGYVKEVRNNDSNKYGDALRHCIFEHLL